MDGGPQLDYLVDGVESRALLQEGGVQLIVRKIWAGWTKLLVTPPAPNLGIFLQFQFFGTKGLTWEAYFPVFFFILSKKSIGSATLQLIGAVGQEKKISMEGSKTEKRLLAGCPWEDGVPCGLHDTLVKCEGGDDGVAHRLHGGDMRQQGQPSMRHLPRKMPLAGLWHSHWVLAFPF